MQSHMAVRKLMRRNIIKFLINGVLKKGRDSYERMFIYKRLCQTTVKDIRAGTNLA